MRLIAALVLAVTMVAVGTSMAPLPASTARLSASGEVSTASDQVSVAAPAARSPHRSPVRLSPPSAALALRDHWTSEGDWYQSTLRNAGAADSILAGARLAGVKLEDLPRATPSIEALPGLSRSLAASMADLTAEVALANSRNRIALNGVRADSPTVARLLQDMRSAITAGPGRSRTEIASVEGRAGAVAAAIDRPAQYSTALALARAVDRNLPSLREAARSMPPSGNSVPVGCDLLDQPPALCLGSTSNHVYRANVDYALQVTLGGTNEYFNSAAGAASGAAVLIDLGAASTFSTQLDAYPTGQQGPCLGAGVLGIGMAILAGTATRIDLATHRDETCGGYGVFGVGLLYDASTSSAWSMRSSTTETQVSSVPPAQQAAGFASTGGIGLAIRHGPLTANLVNLVPPGEVPDVHTAIGYGVGVLGGAGLFYAGGGPVDIQIHCLYPFPGPPSKTGHFLGDLEYAEGMGFGQEAGTGLMVLGDGPGVKLDLSAAEESTVTVPRGTAYASGMGAADFGATGILIDAQTTSRYSVMARHTGGSKLPPSAPGASAYAMGAGRTGGAGILLKTGSLQAEIKTLDEIVGGAGAGSGIVGEGAAGPESLGVLVQTGGLASFSIEARATATQASAGPGPVVVSGQGSGASGGTGWLDVEGSFADSYSARSESEWTGHVAPIPQIAAQGAFWQAPADLVPGTPGGPGWGLVTDGGGCDSFTQVPAEATSTGTRGGPEWVDSGGYGGGSDGGSQSPCP